MLNFIHSILHLQCLSSKHYHIKTVGIFSLQVTTLSIRTRPSLLVDPKIVNDIVSCIFAYLHRFLVLLLCITYHITWNQRTHT